MTQPLRSRDAAPRSQVRPILPPRIDARTHLEVATAYLEMGLPDEAMFELTLVDGDPAARREAERLAARIRARRSPAPPTAEADAPRPAGPSPTRVEGLGPRSRVVRVSAPYIPSVPPPEVDDAIDRAFDECFADIDEASTAPDGAPG